MRILLSGPVGDFGKTSLDQGKSDCQWNFKMPCLHFTPDMLLMTKLRRLPTRGKKWTRCEIAKG